MPNKKIVLTIYAIDAIDDGLYKMNMDGSKIELLISEDIMNYYIHDECVYYTYDYSSYTSEKYDDGIYVMKLDGTGSYRLDIKKPLRFTPIYINSDWIYYLDTESCLYWHNIKNDKSVMLDDKKTGGVNYYNNFILFPSIDNDGNRGIYRMHLDGSEKTLIYQDWAVNPQYADGWVYYYRHEENNSLDGLQDEQYRVRIDGTGGEKVTFSP
jgi:hypothetical protein